MGVSVDVERAHSTNTLAAVVVKHDGFFTLLDELLVENVKRFEERGVGGDVIELVGLKVSFFLGTGLTPYLELETNTFFHC